MLQMSELCSLNLEARKILFMTIITSLLNQCGLKHYAARDNNRTLEVRGGGCSPGKLSCDRQAWLIALNWALLSEVSHLWDPSDLCGNHTRKC